MDRLRSLLLQLGLLSASVFGCPARSQADEFCAQLSAAAGKQSQLDRLQGEKIGTGDALADDLGSERWHSKFKISEFDVCLITKTIVDLEYTCEKALPSLADARRALAELEKKIRVCLPDLAGGEHDSDYVILRSSAVSIDMALSGRSSTTLDATSIIPIVRLKLAQGTAAQGINELYVRFSDAATAGHQDPTKVEGLAAQLIAEVEKAFGADSSELLKYLPAIALNNRLNSKYDEASKFSSRAINIWDHSDKTSKFNIDTEFSALVISLEKAGRTREALAVAKRLHQSRLERFGAANEETITTLRNIGDMLQQVGRVNEASAAFEQALALLERDPASDAAMLKSLTYRVAGQQQRAGNDAIAERLLKKAAGYEENALKEENDDDKAFFFFAREEPQMRIALAEFYQRNGRVVDAERELKAGLKLITGIIGERSEGTIPIRTKLGEFYAARGQAEAAIAQYRSAAAAAQQPSQKVELLSLEGVALAKSGRFQQASVVMNDALAKLAGLEDPDVTEIYFLPELISVDLKLGHAKEAAERSRRMLDLLAKLTAQEELLDLARRDRGSSEASARMDYARALLALKKSAEGCKEGEAATRIFKAINLEDLSSQQALDRSPSAPGEQFTQAALGVLYECTGSTPSARDTLFEYAQTLELKKAARSISQQALRAQLGDGAIAALLRDQQDFTLRRTALADQLAKVRGEDGDSGGKAVALQEAITKLDGELRGVEQHIETQFPEFEQLLRFKVVSAAEAVAELHDNEALLYILSEKDATYLWVLTKNDSRLVRSSVGTSSASDKVRALRCGLDGAAWAGDGEARCQTLLANSFTAADAANGKPLPFDLAKAHEFYAALFNQIEDIIKDKDLLIVPSGPLTQLPFQVLVTTSPTKDDYKSTAWLIRNHAITVLPAVSSLKALRGTAKPSTATRPMIAFANPKLDGDAKKKGNDLRKRLAHYRQDCALPLLLEEEVLRFSMAGFGTDSTIADVKALEPVPGTAMIACDIARDDVFAGSDVLLGARATEAQLKELNKSGELAKYKIVQFATHGLTAGQIAGMTEPGLILTPPLDKPTDADDNGYLTASEITELKLDADWVILSACNTAAGGGAGDEALSGLARAFFYAQARALLVSHWSVNEAAAVKLVTAAVRSQKDAGVGRSQALRSAMLGLIDSGSEREAHPAYWAPFVVVGEGRAAK